MKPFIHIVLSFFYPLGISLVIIATALVAIYKNNLAVSKILLYIVLGILYIFSMPLTSQILLRGLEKQYPPTKSFPKDVSAIALLGGVAIAPFPPRLYPETGEAADRIFYTARLFRQKKAPYIILSSSGKTITKYFTVTESDLLEEILTNVCGIDSSAILKDTSSVNTHSHGVAILNVIKKNNLSPKIILVTSARHMPRAVRTLKKSGLEVYPAPTDFYTETKLKITIQTLLPNTDSLYYTGLALYEYYALFIYGILGW